MAQATAHGDPAGSEAKYRSLFENMDEAFYLAEIIRDAGGRTTDVMYLDENAAGVRLAGMSLVGRRLSETFARAIPEWLPVFDRVARTGKAERFERLSVATGRWQYYHVFPAGSGQERIGILSTDISARKLAEQKLRESEERYRELTNAAPAIIWMSGIDGGCEFINQPWLDITGQTFEAALGKGWTTCIHPDDGPCTGMAYALAIERREPFQITFRIRRTDGEYRWIVSTGSPRFDAGGAFAGFIGSAIDMTERRQAAAAQATIDQQLARAREDERVRIARELHDDVAQPLVGLGFQLAGASRSAVLPEASLNELEGVRAAVLEVARGAQALSHRLHPHWLASLGIASAVQALCGEVSRQEGVEMVCDVGDIPDRLPEENALRLYRVLEEALHSAIMHGRASRIEVLLRARGDELELVVKDFGTGFDPAWPRHQGLGFASLNERLMAIGGRLSIQSQGDGATVRACVPATAD